MKKAIVLILAMLTMIICISCSSSGAKKDSEVKEMNTDGEYYDIDFPSTF